MNLNVNRNQCIAFLNDEGLSYIEKPERGELQLNSPFVADSKKRCGINYRKNGTWNCFKSGQSGSWWEFVASVKSISINEARLLFLKHYYNLGSSLWYSEAEEPEPKENDLQFPGGTISFNPRIHIEYCDYLKNRYFTDLHFNTIKLFVNTSQRRIHFPVYENGKLIFYAGRAIDSNNPLRWLNSGGNAHGPIWGLDSVGDEIWIFEGIFDAIRVYPKGVAIFGNHLREEQLKKLLAKNPLKFVVVCDGDGPGRIGQYKTALKLFDNHPNVWFHVWEPGAKDFGGIANPKPNLIKVDKKFKLQFNFNENINFQTENVLKQ